ncbi:MAG: hypothetical protein AB1744_09515, partial [Candidatus Zixiibacteriota bacterium]
MGRKTGIPQEPSQSFLDSKLFRVGTRLFLALVVILVFLTLVQCTIKKPESPQWNTQLVVPVINRTYPMDELVHKIDQEGIGIDSSGAVSYSLTKELDTAFLDAGLLATADISHHADERLGLVGINPPQVDPVSVSLSSIAGLASGLPGDSASVAPSSFDLYNDMPPAPSYSQATVASGNVNVVVDNNLDIDLDTTIVEVYDVINAVVVATDTFPSGIPAGQSSSLPVALDGKTVSNTFRVNTHCYTPGGTVDSASSRYIETDLVFPDSLQVSSAVAEVPALSRQYQQSFDIDETDRIDTAVLSSGLLSLSITNATDLEGDLTVSIPDLISPGDQQLTISRYLLNHDSAYVTVNLSGYRIVPSDGTVPQAISTTVSAATPGTAPQHVTVSELDSFVVDLDLSNLQFSSVTGVFSSATASVDTVGRDIDVPTGFDSVQFRSATLALEIENGVDLSGTVNIRLQG